MLSLTGVKEGLRGHVVVEMSDLDNEPLVKLVGGELIETVVAHDVIGRLMIQCALQPGLAQVHLSELYLSLQFYLNHVILGFLCDIIFLSTQMYMYTKGSVAIASDLHESKF